MMQLRSLPGSQTAGRMVISLVNFYYMQQQQQGVSAMVVLA